MTASVRQLLSSVQTRTVQAVSPASYDYVWWYSAVIKTRSWGDDI